jgi:ankyrin repeat protein
VDGEWQLLNLPNLDQRRSHTPIYAAVSSGHVEVVDLLIRNGADIQLSLGHWANPLQLAAHTGQLLVVQQLVEKGSATNKPAPYKERTALHFASLEGHDVIVQYLIEVGANVMARDDDLETPLHSALRGLKRSSWLGSSPNGFLRTVQ